MYSMKPMKVMRFGGSYRRWEQERRRKRVIITLTALALLVLVSVVLLLVVTYQPPVQPRAKGDSMDYLMRDGEVVELNVLTGERGTLELPDDLLPTDAKFVSDAPEVVHVDSGGRMDALSVGKAVVTVSAGSFRSICELTVEEGLGYQRPAEITTAITANEDIVEKNRKNGTDDLYYIVVNRRTNVVTIYTYNEEHRYKHPVRAMTCSCGTKGDDITPTGFYNLYFKALWHPLFGDVYGQYVSGIEGPYLFHSVPYYTQNPADLESKEFNKLSTNASQGCVRMAVSDVKWIYDNCPLNTPVRIIDEDSSWDHLGAPAVVKINEKIKWDPTDPDPNNPYRDKLPEITASDITVKVGEKLKLTKGVTAKDICGNDISDRVQVEGKVYKDHPGEYFITYTVEDDYHLRGEHTVKVTVEK